MRHCVGKCDLNGYKTQSNSDLLGKRKIPYKAGDNRHIYSFGKSFIQRKIIIMHFKKTPL